MAEQDNNQDAPLTSPVASPPQSPIPPDPPALDPATAQAVAILSRALGDAFANAMAQIRPTAAPDPTKYPKAKDPNMFNGKRRRYLRTWIGENEICFRTAPNLYRNDTAKVMFAGSFLEGDAKS